MPIHLRPGVEADLPQLTELYNYYVAHSTATFDLHCFTAEQRQTWFAKYQPSGPYRLWVAMDQERLVGYASSNPLRPMPAYNSSIETSVYLAQTHVGHGLGKRLYTELFNSIRAEKLHRAYAAVTRPNPASIALHHQFGFKTVGVFSEAGHKHGQYHDVEWLEKPLGVAS